MISGTLIFVVALAVGVAVAVRPEAPHGPVVGVAVGGGLFLGLMAAPLGVAAVWQRLDGWARRFRAR
jgi:hypothetical protein